MIMVHDALVSVADSCNVAIMWDLPACSQAVS